MNHPYHDYKKFKTDILANRDAFACQNGWQIKYTPAKRRRNAAYRIILTYVAKIEITCLVMPEQIRGYKGEALVKWLAVFATTCLTARETPQRRAS